ncbi:hypothetical protein KY290_032497 [Solanum tuberosum]|uniref:Defensin-like protein n=1 Tax=Solanum tuberosum TaxID=4113 RepID=A0ABQ7UCB5_SOLTU|nr:hypothetical protein KY284_031505 [Solanum tuberosum]KAH0654216.1 hypothetical protein KY289_031894 [Solanum tuberosum]KAH0656839.1 hypothetical protein KY285_031721 [Solanum tuberosum]KAH0744504.1 hypothetical protein KY290_032497 [Solanum tuberosum]
MRVNICEIYLDTHNSFYIPNLGIMKNFSSLVVCLFVLFIVLCTKTRGIHLESSKECNYPLPGAIKPCDPEKCNTQCFDKYQNKPDPPGITGTLLGGTCLGDDCNCTFYC